MTIRRYQEKVKQTAHEGNRHCFLSGVLGLLPRGRFEAPHKTARAHADEASGLSVGCFKGTFRQLLASVHGLVVVPLGRH